MLAKDINPAMSWRMWAPALTGFGLAMLYPVGGGDSLPQRPPRAAFSVIWTVLYILIGISWVLAHRQVGKHNDMTHFALVGALLLWIVVYGSGPEDIVRQRYALYVLGCAFATAVACMSLHTDPRGKLVLAPLVAWLLIAFQLNFALVGETAKK